MRKYQYYDTGADGDRDAYTNNWGGQTFTPAMTHLIASVKLKLFRVGTPGTLTISIRATSAVKPTGGDLCSGEIDADTLTADTNGEWYEITLGDGYEVQPDITYAIIIRAADGDTNNKVSWRADTSIATYPGGSYTSSSDSGADWSLFSGVDTMFEIWGTGPPSPTTVTWGNLFKSQISAEKIEEAINRMIQDHENDPDSHLEIGESLYSHKASEIIDHIVNSIIADKIGPEEVWERHRHSISAWQRLLNSYPYNALNILRKLWTGDTGENNPHGTIFDGTYIYTTLFTGPAKVIKIDPETMETIAVWTGDIGENWISCITYDGTYIYVGCTTDPPKVIKINPSDMTTVDTWTGSGNHTSINGLTSDGTYVYAAIPTTLFDDNNVIKINPSDMSVIDTWVGDRVVHGLTFDGIYIYVTIDDSPGKVVKIDPSDMTTVTVWTGAAEEDRPWPIVFDGTYIYIATFTTTSKVIKIDPSDMTTVTVWTSPAGGNAIQGMYFDGTYIYVAQNTVPGRVAKINPSDMTTVSVWIGATDDDHCWDVSGDGKYIYISFPTTPGRLVRKIMRNIDETGT